ncbi:KICSTOR complex protein kaptin-like [Macrobrachium nipponense]|uniref:KICSTOR complex protein kaptin-like n=1 Tax=Macrobrachium nipponense TaxID=159736 RepID=UPI0030C89737
MAAPQLEDGKSKISLSEAHFFSLLTQGNLYTLTPLTDAKGLTKLLVATLQRKIYCIEYSNGRPLMREVPFTYIPGCAEIVSIDAVNRSIIQEDFIVGITIIKKDDTSGQQSCFFNVYSDWDMTCDSALDVVSQNCLPLELKFVPYHLYHTKTYGKSGWETVWLLSGSDGCIHIYQSDDESHGYQEADTYCAFPEFEDVEGITLCIDVLYSTDDKRRVTATSGENGKVHMFLVNLESTPKIEASRVMEWDYPSPSVKIFNQSANVAVPEILQAFVSKKEDTTSDKKMSPLIAVANSLESCFVYRDVFDNCQGCLLQDTDINDVVTCCIVCDIDQDGELEVLIGTYGQVILIYKNNEEIGQWELYHSVTLPCPVLAMVHCDVMGDGSLQLIVMTTIGIHIFQPDPWELAALLLNRLEKLCDHTHVNGYTSQELTGK